MNRTVEDYDSMAKREMIKAKQEKALMSVSLPIRNAQHALTILFLCALQACSKVPKRLQRIQGPIRAAQGRGRKEEGHSRLC